MKKLSSIAGVVILLAVGTSPIYAQRASGNFDITGVDITSINIVNGVLEATGTVTGTLAGLPFTADITNFALQLVPNNPTTAGTECAILNLELGPIDLALLGLFVNTSEICLEITAFEEGGLLGDLLCDLAGGALLGNLPLVDDVAALESALQSILNARMGGNPTPGHGNNDDVCEGECEILELVLGPLDLTLLGLNVRLDDCNDGPVQVCISASRGEGILGDLLCGLSAPRLARLNLASLTQLVTQAAAFFADGSISGREIGQLTALLARLL